MAAERVLYVGFNNVLDAKDETLQSFGRRLAHVLTERRPEGIVIDLRRNNGGDTYLYQALLRTLVAWDAAGQGRIYAIIGRNTYSAAENFIVDLDRLTDVVFVGEPSGAKPSTHGNESPITLPWSGLQGAVSAVYWQIGDARDKRLWIAPQLFVPPTAQDWLDNRDAPLSAILRHLRARPRRQPAGTFSRVRSNLR
jgi:C-terminal processing protease CtpA/Prc